MSTRIARITPESVGRNVFGPVLAEFYLRLHLITSLMEAQRPGDGRPRAGVNSGVEPAQQLSR